MNKCRELLPLDGIRLQVASGKRPYGYVERCLELGELVRIGDKDFVKFTPENWQKIRDESVNHQVVDPALVTYHQQLQSQRKCHGCGE